MSAPSWKSGDVGVFRVTRWSSAVEWPDDTSVVIMRLAKDGYWNAVKGDPSRPFTVHHANENLHPLVMVDPEDRGQVERLTDAYEDERPSSTDLYDHMQAALRSLVTPPKPAEPQGLGAVVKDDHGEHYVLTGVHEDDDDNTWRCVRTGNDFSWMAFKAVRVLSEGWRA